MITSLTNSCQCKDCKKNPTEEQAKWAAWVETVFWPVSGCLKHGGFLFGDLTKMSQYSDLYMKRSHKFGGDDLHGMREQIWVEYNIPAKHEKLWPSPKNRKGK